MKTLSILLFLFLTSGLVAQNETHLTFISNLRSTQSESQYSDLRKQLDNVDRKTILIGLGDYLGNNTGKKSFLERNRNHLEALTEAALNSKRYFLLSGDQDWNNSGKHGLNAVDKLDDFLEDEMGLKKGLRFDKGCLGPEVYKLTEDATLVIINSQWFIHPHEKPQSTDEDCQFFNAEDFWEELEDLLEDEEGKWVILAAHHDLASTGTFSGQRFYKQRWKIPLAGQFIADYRKNVGRPADFSFTAYKLYRDRMFQILQSYNNIIYVSGHENTKEIHQIGNNYFLSTGGIIEPEKSATNETSISTSNVVGATTMMINKGGQIEILFGQNEPPIKLWKSGSAGDTSIQELDIIDTGKYIAGPEYKAGGFKRFWMGDHYRDEWTSSISAPPLYIKEKYGGLRPYAKGGGLQTLSLKFKSLDGKKYAFRSINKNPEKGLSQAAKQTIYRSLVKDLITTQHPYGGLAASALMDKTDILHSTPELYYMPDQEALGEYREEFAGTLGTLELRPDEDDAQSFGGADNIVSTHQMYRNLINEDNHKVDKKSYARARVFDIWLGDWDRHQDNWKWAAFQDGDLTIYRPIPRDRDHVFSKWEGVIPTFADWFIPNAENFGHRFGNIRHLNWKARHLDRFVGNEISREDWIQAAQYLRETFDSIEITNAVAKMPREVLPFSGSEISNKLLSRLSDLERGVNKHYDLLAKEVNVVGSNKKDEITLESNGQGGIRVFITDKNKTTYDRVFHKQETTTIYIYGLGKKDDITLKYRYYSPIKIRIIAGKGEDSIIDIHPQIKKDVKIYDYHLQDRLIGDGLKRQSTHQEPEFKVNDFEYPAFFPFLGLKNSSGNGTGIELSLSQQKKVFNKPGYGSSTQFSAIYYPTWNAYLADLAHSYKYIWGTQDLYTRVTASSQFSKYPFFYGLGSDTERDDELHEDGFYRIEYATVKTRLGLSKIFLQRSQLRYYLMYEFNSVDSEEEEGFLGQIEDQISGLGPIHNIGAGLEMDLDMRDSRLFTRHGSLLKTSLQYFHSDRADFAKLHVHLAKYSTYHLWSPTTFIIASGLFHTYGDAPFYQQSTLGSNTYLRGHVRNRYVDRSAFYYNTEIRTHLGTFRTFLAPIRYGLYLFHDNGKVYDGSFNLTGGFKPTYGIGTYLAPLSDHYSLTLKVAKSDDQDIYFRMDFGWAL